MINLLKRLLLNRWVYPLLNAEVARMHDALIDIVDMCNSDVCTWQHVTDDDWMRLIDKIDDVAHRGLYGGEDG